MSMTEGSLDSKQKPRVTMQLTTVESSMIHAVGYDGESGELEVVFNSGQVYRYVDVPSMRDCWRRNRRVGICAAVS